MFWKVYTLPYYSFYLLTQIDIILDTGIKRIKVRGGVVHLSDSIAAPLLMLGHSLNINSWIKFSGKYLCLIKFTYLELLKLKS